MEKLLIVVPARGGSMRLPGKNLRSLGGRSLMARTRDAVRDAGIESPCLLTTDDAEIAEAGRRLGWLAPFLRPAELARDDTPTLPAVMHAVDWFSADSGDDPGMVMLLQLTSPFRKSATLRRGLDLMAARPEIDAVVSVLDLQRRPEHVFRCAGDGVLTPLSGAPEAVTTYVPNGVLYLIRTTALRTHRTFFPPAMCAVIGDALESIDIDTELDWHLAETAIDSGLTG